MYVIKKRLTPKKIMNAISRGRLERGFMKMKIAKKEDLWRINENKSYDWKCAIDLEGAG
jgi:hypothetical protein